MSTHEPPSPTTTRTPIVHAIRRMRSGPSIGARRPRLNSLASMPAVTSTVSTHEGPLPAGPSLGILVTSHVVVESCLNPIYHSEHRASFSGHEAGNDAADENETNGDLLDSEDEWDTSFATVRQHRSTASRQLTFIPAPSRRSLRKDVSQCPFIPDDPFTTPSTLRSSPVPRKVSSASTNSSTSTGSSADSSASNTPSGGHNGVLSWAISPFKQRKSVAAEEHQRV